MENKIKSAVWNNVFHTLPMYRECGCSFTMKLEAYEDTRSNVRYQYECVYKNCLKVIKLESNVH